MRYLLLLAAFLLASCSPSTPAPAGKAATGTVLSAQDLRLYTGAMVGDTAYAVVSEQWLLDFYTEFRNEIFRKGVVKWDPRFDCNHFAGYYASLAQTKFYLDNFQSATPAQSLAVGTFWYRPNNGPAGHAIVIAFTEKGVRFLEPQTGRFVSLTPDEQRSAFLKVF